MQRILYFTIVFLCISFCISCTSSSNSHDAEVQEFHNVSYGKNKGNVYDLFLPNPTESTDTLALILYIHGGSWMGGDKVEHHSDCRVWADKGYATATMNYSLLLEDGVSINTMLDEIKKCIVHICQFAAEKDIIINQMAIAGTSAGGHLAMMYAYSRQHVIPLKFEAIKVGPSDFRILFPYDPNSSEEDTQNLVFNCTGKRIDVRKLSIEQLDSIKLTASPVHYINDSTAIPAIWAYGEKDWLVIPDHYKALKARYDSLGATYSLIVFPNSDHALWHDRDCKERYESTMDTYCKKYFGY